MLSLMLLAALAAPTPRPMPPGPPLPQVGGEVLLTLGATAGPNGQVVRETPFLLNAAGQPLPRGAWVNRPLKVVQDTGAAYVLDGGAGQGKAYLPKRNLQKKAVFPLLQSAETQRLSQELVGGQVWFNGQPDFACEIVEGYHAGVMVESAEVSGVWQLDAPGLNISPQGGMVDGGMLFNERQATAPLLVMLGKLEKPKAVGASLNAGLQGQSSRLMGEAAQRCPTLPAVYATPDDVRRTLAKAEPPKLVLSPQRAAQLEKVLVGKTRGQILATYGNPDDEGSLATLLTLPTWHYGDVPYNRKVFNFDASGRVSQATIAESP